MTALLLVRVSLLLGCTLAGVHLLRRSAASTRHAIWTMAFAALLTLPALPYVLPAIDVPVPERWRPAARAGAATVAPVSSAAVDAVASAGRPSSADAPSPPANPNASPETEAADRRVTPRTIVTGVWALGCLAALSSLLLSLIRVRALERSTAALADGEWRTAADAIAARLGCPPARLRTSARIATPMASGLTQPTIYLPAGARSWPAGRRDIVLAHELAHLARRDPLRHIAARAAVALYWFHPLAWMAAAAASVAREQACDETVLALGTRPSAYAQVLLDFAASQAPLPAVAALPIVERSLLEKRLMAILAHDTPVSIRRRPVLAVAATAVLAVAVAVVRPAAPAAMGGIVAVPVVTSPAAAAEPQRATAFDRSCTLDSGLPFRGSMSSSSRGGERIVYDAIGTSGADRIILKSLGDLRVCMIGEGVGGDDDRVRPSDWPGRARRTVIEARQGAVAQRLELTREGAAQRAYWTVGGVERPFDAAAQEWRERMLAVLDTTWDLAGIRGEVSTLRGEISTIRGEESTLRGEISTVRGEVSTMRGQISSIRGDESSLRGEISSVLGHVSSLRGAISSEQGSISSLTASRYDASDAERSRIAARIREHDAEIARLEKQIRDYDADGKIAAIERQIRDLDVEKKVAAIEAQIRAFNADGKVAEIEKRIQELDVRGKTGGIERQIEGLDADRRARELEDRRARELKQLQDAIARIR